MTKKQFTELLITNGYLDTSDKDLMNKLELFVNDRPSHKMMYLLNEKYIDNIDLFFKECVPPQVEFCFYKDFNPNVIAKIMKKGCFFMSTDIGGISVPFIHEHLYKCIIPLNPVNKFHYHKSINRIARKHPNWTLSFDNCISSVIYNINKNYEDSWITNDLAKSYTILNFSNRYNIYPIHFHSVELFDEEDNLIAGEIGFVTGESYVSLSGFHNVSDSGNVQMAALGTYLLQNGFKIWDLGMQLDYKYNYGAIDFDRQAQLDIYSSLSDKPLLIKPYQNIKIKDLLK